MKLSEDFRCRQRRSRDRYAEMSGVSSAYEQGRWSAFKDCADMAEEREKASWPVSEAAIRRAVWCGFWDGMGGTPCRPEDMKRLERAQDIAVQHLLRGEGETAQPTPIICSADCGACTWDDDLGWQWMDKRDDGSYLVGARELAEGQYCPDCGVKLGVRKEGDCLGPH